MKPARPRLILADDHEIVLDGLRMLLQSEFDLVATATDGAQLLDVCRRMKPDVVVTDISMPKLSGLDAAEALLSENAGVRVIILTVQAEPEFVLRAFRAGVAGFVVKHSAGCELISAIREVIAGRTFISPRISRIVMNACLDDASSPTAEAPFTTRQIEVLQLIARGLTMKEIGARLGIATRTAEAHKYQMMERHRVRTVAELIRLGMQFGVVETPRLTAGANGESSRPPSTNDDVNQLSLFLWR
jgi:DNA-binding NarL/FixJ family response regulator